MSGMARNIEIKARLADLSAARAAAIGLGARAYVVEEQVDSYYALESGRRVKVRRNPEHWTGQCYS